MHYLHQMPVSSLPWVAAPLPLALLLFFALFLHPYSLLHLSLSGQLSVVERLYF
jgi:hypothetical protein